MISLKFACVSEFEEYDVGNEVLKLSDGCPEIKNDNVLFHSPDETFPTPLVCMFDSVNKS